jgi:type I restriction enzyme S subunit
MKREMKHSGVAWIGEIPKHWEVVRNKNAFSNSKTIVGESWNNTQLLSLTTKGIKAIDIGSTSGKVPDSYETYQVVGKDNLVMCLFDLDCSAVFSGLSQIEGMISPAYKVLTVQNGFLPAFYDKWFNYIFDGRKFMFLSKNIRYSLTYDEFASLQIVKPPIEEQQKIAKFLDRKCGEIDEMISLQEKVIEELKAYKQSIITEAVTKGLNPNVAMRDSEIEWIGEIPEHWEIEPLKYNFNRRSERNNPIITMERLSLSIDKGVTLYSEKTTNLDRFKEDFTQYQLAYPNDIVLNCMNMIVGAVGMSKYLGCVSPVYYVIYSSKFNVDSEYYSYLLNTPTIRGVYYSYGKGIYAIERGEGKVNTCRLKVSYDDFGRFNIPIPPIEEQKEIAEFLDRKCNEIDRLIEIKGKKIEELKEYRKSLIYEYVTGKKEI